MRLPAQQERIMHILVWNTYRFGFTLSPDDVMIVKMKMMIGRGDLKLEIDPNH
jgi:hypothetical protein